MRPRDKTRARQRAGAAPSSSFRAALFFFFLRFLSLSLPFSSLLLLLAGDK